jgi:hypothetical protein
MKRTLIPILALVLACTACQNRSTEFVSTTDVYRFWEAYDQIVATDDTSNQRTLLRSLYLEPGTPGLNALRERRGYTEDVYLEAIRSYPQFWASVRKNTLRSSELAGGIDAGVAKFKDLYPAMKPAQVYFTIGALYTGGTTLDSLVLIGAELALADSSVVTSELPERLGENLSRFFATNPINDVVLLNVHEFVHTQQNSNGYDLLSQCLYEGVAEFVSVLALETESAVPAVDYGQQNTEVIRTAFAKQAGSPHWNDWLYNDFGNDFGVRDLGYYMGYAMCESYYDQAADKQAAIARMIELDYTDTTAVETFINESGYFDEPVDSLKADFERNRPYVTGIREVRAGSMESVDPGLTQLTVEFSEPMSTRFRNQRYGPLGADGVLPVRSLQFSPDKQSIVIGVDLEPGRRYQLQLTDQYRSLDGRVMQPYLIDIQTRK